MKIGRVDRVKQAISPNLSDNPSIFRKVVFTEPGNRWFFRKVPPKAGQEGPRIPKAPRKDRGASVD